MEFMDCLEKALDERTLLGLDDEYNQVKQANRLNYTGPEKYRKALAELDESQFALLVEAHSKCGDQPEDRPQHVYQSLVEALGETRLEHAGRGIVDCKGKAILRSSRTRGALRSDSW